MSQSVTFYSTIKSSEVEWLWYPYIPFGKITLVQGDPGEGKSTLALKLASIVSAAGMMPDGRISDNKHKVMYQCVEDDISDTIKPRLENNGADLENVAFIGDGLNPTDFFDEESLLETIRTFDVRLFVIDPVQSFIGKNSNVYDVCRIREFMGMIARVANRTNCAFVLISHLNKNESGKDLYRGLGSIDFVASARSVLQIGRLSDGSNIRVIKHIKSSLAPEGDCFAFEIVDDSGVEWIGNVDVDEEIAVSDQAIQSKGNKYGIIKKKLKSWLRKDDLPYSEVLSRSQALNVGVRTMNEAKKELKIHSIKRDGHWYWHMDKEERNIS